MSLLSNKQLRTQKHYVKYGSIKPGYDKPCTILKYGTPRL